MRLVISSNLPPILHRFRDIQSCSLWYVRIFATPLSFNTPPPERFPWDHLCKNFTWLSTYDLGTKHRRNITVYFNRLSRSQKRYRRQTDDSWRDDSILRKYCSRSLIKRAVLCAFVACFTVNCEMNKKHRLFKISLATTRSQFFSLVPGSNLTRSRWPRLSLATARSHFRFGVYSYSWPVITANLFKHFIQLFSMHSFSSNLTDFNTFYDRICSCNTMNPKLGETC